MSLAFFVRVPGSTSNVGPGFDVISAALTLYLELRVDEIEGDPGFIRWPESWELKEEENAILVAFRKACRELNVSPPALRIHVRNEIPLKRGLGSSAAAYVAGVKMAEYLSDRSLSDEEVFDLVLPLEGHPENLAASLLGGWTISCVKGERMMAQSVPSRLAVRFVAVIPEVVVSTAAAREILPEAYPLADVVFNLQRCALLVHSIAGGEKQLLAEATQDRIHQSYRASLVPQLEELLAGTDQPEWFRKAVFSLTISGSGSTLLAIAEDRFEEIGEWLVAYLRDRGVPSRYQVLDLDPKGVRVGR